MPRLVYVVTAAITANSLLRGQLKYMNEHGFEVILITSPSSDLKQVAARENIMIRTVPMEREIRLLQDSQSLFALHREIRRLNPDIVNAGTPKAGLLGMVAARMAGVPVRIYTLRGLRLESAKGLQRSVLRTTERIASGCATQVLCVSESLKTKFLELKLCPRSKATVLGNGSSNGVDYTKFAARANAENIRKDLNLPQDAFVIGFLGRLTKDKGVAELVEAFEMLQRKYERLFLMIIGDFEQGDPVDANIISRLNSHPRILHKGFASDTAPFYAAMDVLAFPSHREGFPNVPLEAAAAGIPTVGFQVTGTVDAVQDGITGQLVSRGNVGEFAHAIEGYLQNDELRRQHGHAAQQRARESFDHAIVWNSLLNNYNSLLS